MSKSKIKYSRQRSKVDCGAVVIANASRWAGMNFSYTTHRNFLLRELEIQKYGGVFPDIVLEFIEHSNTPFKTEKFKEALTPQDLNDILKRGRAAIVFLHTLFNGHVFLVVGVKSGKYECVNYFGTKGPTVSYITERDLKKARQLDAIIIKKVLKRG